MNDVNVSAVIGNVCKFYGPSINGFRAFIGREIFNNRGQALMRSYEYDEAQKRRQKK